MHHAGRDGAGRLRPSCGRGCRGQRWPDAAGRRILRGVPTSSTGIMPCPSVAQAVFDQSLRRRSKQLSHGRLRRAARRPRQPDVYLDVARQPCKTFVGGAMVSPSQTSSPSTAALASPRMRSAFLFGAAPVANVERKTQQQARSRIASSPRQRQWRASRPASPIAETVILGRAR